MALFAVSLLLLAAVCWTGTEGTDPASCKAILDADPTSADGSYTIDPDGDGGVDAFQVDCDMSTGFTIIHHNRECFTDVPPGYAEPGSWHVNISYTHTMDQMIALVDSVADCKMAISLKCNNVQIWKDVNGVRTQHTCWNNRNGDMRPNWGASDGTEGCKCSDDGNCVGGGDCNCDSDTNTEDKGYLTVDDDLPVSKLQFGDTADGSSSYRLGPLKCK